MGPNPQLSAHFIGDLEKKHGLDVSDYNLGPQNIQTKSLPPLQWESAWVINNIQAHYSLRWKPWKIIEKFPDKGNWSFPLNSTLALPTDLFSSCCPEEITIFIINCYYYGKYTGQGGSFTWNNFSNTGTTVILISRSITILVLIKSPHIF